MDRHRSRTITAAVLGTVAVLVLTVTVVSVWARAIVLQREPVAELVGDALAEPEVQSALAEYLADQVAAAVDLEEALVGVLPDALDRFAPTIAGGANAALERALTRVLGSEEVEQALVTLIERAHDLAMSLLQGDGLADGITVVDGEVTLNVLPLIARGLTALQSLGLLQDVDVPALTADGDPSDQVAQLSAALDRELPSDFGQLVVYQSDSLAEAEQTVQNAQRLLVLAKRATWVLVALTLVLIGATIAVAVRRWRAALVLGLGAAATMVVLRVVVRLVVDDAPDLADRAGAQAAIGAIVGGASVSLLRLAGIVLVVALVVVLIAVLRRRRLRTDLVLVAAVVLGTATVAFLGASAVSLAVGLLVGIAVSVIARLAWPPGPPSAIDVVQSS